MKRAVLIGGPCHLHEVPWDGSPTIRMPMLAGGSGKFESVTADYPVQPSQRIAVYRVLASSDNPSLVGVAEGMSCRSLGVFFYVCDS